MDVRIQIWSCAIQGIKASPLLGQGPFTYMMILDKYNGHLTQHAHSVYLDPLLSFGIIGLACLVPYIYDNCKRLYKVKEHYSYIALVMGFIGVLLIHGILDYTIFGYTLVYSSYLYYLVLKCLKQIVISDLFLFLICFIDCCYYK